MVEKEFALIFEVIELNNELEELVPISVEAGKHIEKGNQFKAEMDETVYKHITKAKVGELAFGGRIKIDMPNFMSPDEEKLVNEYIEEGLLEEYNASRYYRYSKTPNVIMESVNGEYMKIYDDMDCEKPQQKEISTPQAIEKEIEKTVRGQDAAVKKIVSSLWITYKFAKMTKKNMLVIGPSGVGKTIIFQKLSEILDVPVTIFSVPGLSQAGYKGRDTDEILKQTFYDCEGNIDAAEHSIVVLDEIDKIAYGANNSGDVSTSGVQNELLKIVEGCVRNVDLDPSGNTFEIDTSNIIFVGTGAFSELYDKKNHQGLGFNSNTTPKTEEEMNNQKLIKYGLKRELMRRFPIVVELNAMTKDILKDIILNSDESELGKTLESLNSLGITVDNVDELIDMIADDALKLGIGASGLVTTINDIFMEIFYQIANNPDKYERVVLGKNILKDNTDFVLIEKQEKKSEEKAKPKIKVKRLDRKTV